MVVMAICFIREPKALTTAVTATSQVEHQKLMVIRKLWKTWLILLWKELVG
jgi:hypothetical protein